MLQPLDERFRILSVQVEERAVTPAIILVTGAQRSDGTTYVAAGLARAFAEGGQRTLLVDANGDRFAIARELGVAAVPIVADRLVARNGEIPRLAVTSLTTRGADAVSGERLHRVVEEMRAEFDVTVVDAASLPGSSRARQLARDCDALLIALRFGRRADDADAELARALEPHRGRVVGVVTTGPRARRGAVTGERPAEEFTPSTFTSVPRREAATARR